MKKPKVLKARPKSKTRNQPKPKKQPKTQQVQNQFADKYLQFYDDIKTPTKRHDW